MCKRVNVRVVREREIQRVEKELERRAGGVCQRQNARAKTHACAGGGGQEIACVVRYMDSPTDMARAMAAFTCRRRLAAAALRVRHPVGGQRAAACGRERVYCKCAGMPPALRGTTSERLILRAQMLRVRAGYKRAAKSYCQTCVARRTAQRGVQ